MAISNYIINITQMSLDLAQKNPLPPVSNTSPGQHFTAFNTIPPPDAHTGSLALPTSPIPNKLTDYRSNSILESNKASKASFHTLSSSQAIITDSSPDMFPIHSLIEFIPADSWAAMIIIPNNAIPDFISAIMGWGLVNNPDNKDAASNGLLHTFSSHTMSLVDKDPDKETKPTGILLLILPRHDPYTELPIQISNSEDNYAAFTMDHRKKDWVHRPVKVPL